jgi:hypothetical protein
MFQRIEVPQLHCEAFPTDPVILHHSSVTVLNLILYTLYYINVCLFIENLPTAQLIQCCSGNDRKIINSLNAESNPICHLSALLGAHHILHVSRIRVNDKLEKYELHKFPAQTEEYLGLRFKLRYTKISIA